MQKKMKHVILLTIDFPPMNGGMARHSHDVVRAMSSAGFDVTVIAPSNSATEPEYTMRGLKIVRPGHIFDNYLRSVLAFFFAGLSCALRRKTAIIAANTWTVAGVAAFIIGRFTGIPYIVFAHGLDVYAPQASKKAKWLMDIVLENASLVVANSNFTKRLVSEATTQARVAVLNPIVDATRFFATVAPITGSAPSRKTILTVARLVESKGHDLVIRSLPQVLERFPDTVYKIVGSGPQEAALKRLAEELNISDHVIFAGEVDEGSLAAHYRGCDVFVLASRQIPRRGEVEGFGIVFLEAGALSKPVIGSRSGGIPDAVEDVVNGLLVEPENPDAIAEAVIRLFSDSDLARRMGEAGKMRSEREFSTAVFSRRLKDVLGRVEQCR